LPSYQGDILLLLAIIPFAALLVTRRIKAKSEVQIVSEKLDNRDLLVIEAIKRGYKTLTEISNFTGIPKTTTYRRLKKLTSLGYLQETREYGRVIYDLNLRRRGTRTKINKRIVEKMRDIGKEKKKYNFLLNSC
jgi:Uncharacterized membrane-associated protein/domain